MPGIPGERYCAMAYNAPKPRKRFYFRINEQEREQIDYIMQREGIPDASKTLRYVIAEKAEQLQENDRLDYLVDIQLDERARQLRKNTPQKEKGAA